MSGNKLKRKPKNEIKFNLVLDDDQKKNKRGIIEHPISIILGKTGTGKTLLATQIALDLFFNREINKIIITRPTVSTENNGYLPGSMEEKMDPWLVPIRDNMYKLQTEEKIKSMELKKDIELVPLSYFRGRTFDKAVIIVDEFQNLTESQFEMSVGRLGKGSKILFCGDYKQCDLHKEKGSYDLVQQISKSNSVFKMELTINHRHEVLDEIFKLIEDYKNGN